MLVDSMMQLFAKASLAFVQAAEAGDAAAPAVAGAKKAVEEAPPPYIPTGTGLMPAEWSTVSSGIDGVYYFITLLSAFFLVLITVLTVYFAVKYRRKGHVVPTGGPTHHTPLELTWSIIPLLLVIAIFYVGMKGYVALRTSPIDAYTVNVTAQKWSWSFQHPNGANEVGILRVPAGRPVRLVMRSEDVLHSLYIPAFRIKQDVVPGRLTEMWFEAKEPPDGKSARTDLVCAEYCGTEHSKMFAQVYIYSEAEFGPAITDAARWIDKVADEDLWWNAGPRIYARCASCHSLKEGERKTGPSFRGLYDKLAKGDEKFDDGSVLKDIMGPGLTYASVDDYIRQSLLLPQKHVVESYPRSMPTFQGQLKDRHIQAVTSWLQHLDKFDDEGKLKEPVAGDAG